MRCHFLNLLRLEDRVNPAPNVTASLSAGTLTLIGTDAPGKYGDNLHEFSVLNIGGGAVQVSGENGTTIAGATSKQFAGVKALTIKTGLGNDKVSLYGLSLTGPLNINGGTGNNTVLFNASGAYAGVSIVNGEGFDSTHIGSGTGHTYVFSGAVAISGGSGGSDIRLGGAGDQMTANSLTVSNGEGFDQVRALGTSLMVNGATNLAYGSSGSVTYLEAKSVTLNGALTISASAGNDTVSIGKEAVGTTVSTKAITITSGDGIGDFDLRAEQITIAGNVTVTAGNDFDSFDIDGTKFVQTCKITGNLNLNLAGGGSKTELQGKTSVTVTGAVSITNLAGDEVATIGDTKVELGSLSISAGNGYSETRLSGNTKITGALKITGGDGDDLVNIIGSSLEVGGATTLNYGNGGTTTFLNAVTMNLGGPLSLSAQFGPDTFNLTPFVVGVAKALNFSPGAGSALVEISNCTTGAINFVGGSREDHLVLGTVPGPVVVNGNITFSGGAGDDRLRVGKHGVSTAVVNGAISFTGGADADILAIGQANVTGPVTANAGTGADTVYIDNSTFGSTVMIDTGSDSDQVAIEQLSADGTKTKFNTAVTLKLGSGDDVVNLDYGEDDGATFVTKLTIDGGADLDIVFRGAGTVTFGMPRVVIGVESEI